MSEALETRTTLVPRLGTKICLLVAIPFLLVGLFYLFAPITEVRTNTGAVFDCGTAVNPPSAFQQNICQGLTRRYQFKAGALILSGVLIAGVGTSMFGADRRIEHALPRDQHA